MRRRQIWAERQTKAAVDNSAQQMIADVAPRITREPEKRKGGWPKGKKRK